MGVARELEVWKLAGQKTTSRVIIASQTVSGTIKGGVMARQLRKPRSKMP
jgi:hypothetical protein